MSAWQGEIYPWQSARVLSTLIIGFVIIIAFVLYGPWLRGAHHALLTRRVESYMPLQRPLIPMRLFRSRDFCVLTIVSGVGGMLYYSMNGPSASDALVLIKEAC